MNTDNELYRYVPNVHFELIPIKDLVSNQDYQRNISMQHVEKAAAHFDICQINPVKVSRRDGMNYVFNGQHTIEIVALKSGSRETPVWCMIYDDLAYTQEADIFANQQKYVKNLLPYEVFMAHIEAGSDKQLLIRDLVESYHLTISNKSGPATIRAVAALENVHDRYGYHILDRTLSVLVRTWEGDSLSFSSNMLNGTARLLYCYGDAIKDAIFVERLSRVSVKEIARNAKLKREGSLGYAEEMLQCYNKNTRHRLAEAILFANKPPKLKRKDAEELPPFDPETGEILDGPLEEDVPVEENGQMRLDLMEERNPA